MPCRIGITTDPLERNRYWRSQYTSLTNWRIIGSRPSKTMAQTEESLIANNWGCDASPGGAGPEYATWYIYAFEHNGY